MFEFHADRKRYFDIQVSNAQKSLIPFIEKVFPVKEGMRVLEIGCGEAGVLKAFIDRGCTCVGVELDTIRTENAKVWLADEVREGRISFVEKDIYLSEREERGGDNFDIVILKDVIEHIHDHEKIIEWMKSILSPGGVIFFGFPPWRMPFGGHQQICHNKWLSKLPWYHLLPAGLYRGILRKFHEPVEELMEIRDTRISIGQFERIVRKKKYKIIHRLHYLINPIYEWKFGLSARPQLPIIRDIPWLRDFVTTCVFYLITPISTSPPARPVEDARTAIVP